MRKGLLFVAIFVVLTGFSGCATFRNLGKGGWTWKPYTAIRGNRPDDAGWEFIDLSGRADARQKIQKLEFTKMGMLEYSFVLTPSESGREVKKKEMLDEAKSLGADAARQMDHSLLPDGNKYIALELIKFWE
ncbi:MAG: hypothetical protein U0944_00335 [Candidatus Moranbacteria bacterium]|nr:hypothetical protein [Candidatus Moranbacteria bacterium]